MTRWFVRRRAVAISIASTGLSLGGVVLTPLAAAGIEKYGLEVTTLWMAVTYLVGIVPVTAIVLRPYPASLGQLPDGDATSERLEPPESSGTGLRHALSTRFYVAMTIGFAFVMAAQVGGIAHQFKLVATRVDTTFAALAVSALAATSIVGRLTGGWIVTMISMRGFTVAMAFLQAVSLVILGLGQTRAALLAGTLLFGVTMGNLLMLQPLLLAEAFGVRDYGRIYAISYLITTVGYRRRPLARRSALRRRRRLLRGLHGCCARLYRCNGVLAGDGTTHRCERRRVNASGSAGRAGYRIRARCIAPRSDPSERHATRDRPGTP